MEIAHVFTILGALLTIFLAINAYFIRELVQSIQKVEVGVASSVAELTEKYKSADKRISKNDEDIEMLRDRTHELANKIQGTNMKVALAEKDIDTLRNNKQRRVSNEKDF